MMAAAVVAGAGESKGAETKNVLTFRTFCWNVLSPQYTHALQGYRNDVLSDRMFRVWGTILDLAIGTDAVIMLQEMSVSWAPWFEEQFEKQGYTVLYNPRGLGKRAHLGTLVAVRERDYEFMLREQHRVKGCTNVLTCMVVQHRKTKRHVAFASYHAPLKLGDIERRAENIEGMAKWIVDAQLRHPTTTFVFGGDFNTKPTCVDAAERVVHKTMPELGFVRDMSDTSPTTAARVGKPGSDASEWTRFCDKLDYTFVKPDSTTSVDIWSAVTGCKHPVEKDGADVLPTEEWPSDHLAVTSIVTLTDDTCVVES